MTMSSFDRLATKTASTKRAPAPTATKHVGAPTTKLTGLKCLPLDPNLSDSVREAVSGAPYVPLQTMIHGDYDILEGDILVVDTVEYPIRVVRRFDWLDSEYRVIVVEEKKP
jgi:hypothetical protein